MAGYIDHKEEVGVIEPTERSFEAPQGGQLPLDRLLRFQYERDMWSTPVEFKLRCRQLLSADDHAGNA